MGLDIRWPIGLMFTLIGALLTVYGMIVKSDNAISLGININFIWGIVLLVFGLAMLGGAFYGRGKKEDGK